MLRSHYNPKYNLLTTAIILILCETITYAVPTATGLSFIGNPEQINSRTSYQVFNKPIKSPKDSLVISFETALINIHDIGHILTCQSTKEEIFTLFVKRDFTDNKSLIFTLNFPHHNARIAIPFDDYIKNINVWFNVIVCINKDNQQVTLHVNNKSETTSLTYTESNTEKINLHFGKYEHYLDVTPFCIKNLRINIDRRSYKFDLDETEGEVVHNNKGKSVGHVTNPNWLHNQHIKWVQMAAIDEDEIAAVYPDKNNRNLIFYTSNAIYRYNLFTDQLSTKTTERSECFDIIKGGGANYVTVPGTDSAIIFNNKATPHSTAIVSYNEATDKLTYESENNLGHRYHHNSAFIDKKGQNIYQFGGYCQFHYYNTFRRMKRGEWEWNDIQFSGDTLIPRHYSAVTTDFSEAKEDVYIFGGYGNETGLQEAGAIQLADLYKIDLQDMSIKKICDIKNGPEMVPCRDLIRNDDGTFYTLMYAHHIPQSTTRLYKIDPFSGTMLPYSDTIEFLSFKISTQVHLFENKKAASLICVIQEFTKPDQSTIKIYKLRTPVFPFQQKTINNHPHKSINITIFIILLLLISAVIIVLSIKRRHQIKKTNNQHLNSIDKSNDENIIISTKEIDNDDVIDEVHKNTIYILGDFTVFDKNGSDITYLFSAKIRQLLMLILMFTYRKTSKGITAKEISSIIWPEKDYAQSKNIRGVTIKNLRDALSTVDGIKLVSTNGKWNLEIDENICHCDFLQIIDADISEIDNYDDIRPYMHLLRRGSLLMSEHYDWLDIFKSEYEEIILNNFGTKMRSSFNEGQYLISYKISQVLLTLDTLNEDIMKIEINSLIRMGDPIKAKIKFRQFSINYYSAYEKDLIYEDYVIE